MSCCMRCRTSFTPFRRKHHCRLCGGIYCSPCSSSSLPLPQLGYPTPVRLCLTCAFLTAHASPTPPTLSLPKHETLPAPLLDLASATTPPSPTPAAELVLSVCSSPLYASVYGRVGGISTCVALLASPSSPPATTASASLILARLARFELFRHLISGHGEILFPRLVELLSSRSPALVHAAGVAITELALASGRNRVLLAQAGAVQRLLAHVVDAARDAQSGLDADADVARAASLMARTAPLLRALGALLLDLGNRVDLLDRLIGVMGAELGESTRHRHPHDDDDDDDDDEYQEGGGGNGGVGTTSLEDLETLLNVSVSLCGHILSIKEEPGWVGGVAKPDRDALPGFVYGLVSVVSALAQGVGSFTADGNDALLLLLMELPTGPFLLQALALFASPLAELASLSDAFQMRSLEEQLSRVSPFALLLNIPLPSSSSSSASASASVPKSGDSGQEAGRALAGAAFERSDGSWTVKSGGRGNEYARDGLDARAIRGRVSVVTLSVEGSRMATHGLALLARFPIFAEWMSSSGPPPPRHGHHLAHGTQLLYALRDVLTAPSLCDEAYTVCQALCVVSLVAANRAGAMLTPLYPHIVSLLATPNANPAVAGAAAAGLVTIAQVEGSDVVAPLLEDDLDAIISLLSSRHRGLHAYGAGLVSILAESEYGRALVGRSSGLRPLFSLLSLATDPQTQILVCLSVGLLSLNLTNAIRMVEFGVLPRLIELTTLRGHASMRLKFVSSWVLVSLLVHATSASNRDKHEAANTAQVVRSVSTQWRESLSSLMDTARESGAPPVLPPEYAVWRSEAHFPVHHLTRLSQATQDIDAKTWLAWALSWLSFQDDYHGPFASSLLKTIHVLGETESRHVQCGVALTLYNMSLSGGEEIAGLLIEDPRIVPLLRTLANSFYEDTRFYAQTALQALHQPPDDHDVGSSSE